MKLPAQVNKSEIGTSLVELIVVLVIVTIMSAFAFSMLRAPRMMNAEAQAVSLINILQEARQRSLSQRRTMRVEINSTKRLIRLINENAPGTIADDEIIKSTAYIGNGIQIGTTPSNMTGAPTELSPVPVVTFSVSLHPLSIGDQVATLRFLRNGTVVNAGTNAVGANAVVTGATVYVWAKSDTDASSNPTVATVFRAVTVSGSSGAARLWKCPNVNNQCSSWTK
jgi:Tfp pilus assembly protein FimT